jgi:hypothetical protein
MSTLSYTGFGLLTVATLFAFIAIAADSWFSIDAGSSTVTLGLWMLSLNSNSRRINADCSIDGLTSSLSDCGLFNSIRAFMVLLMLVILPAWFMAIAAVFLKKGVLLMPTAAISGVASIFALIAFASAAGWRNEQVADYKYEYCFGLQVVAWLLVTSSSIVLALAVRGGTGSSAV